MTEDGCWADTVLDDEVLKGSWLFQSFVSRGTKVVSGSDWFVTEPNPIQGI